MTDQCKRCGHPERGFDARYSWTTKRFAASLGKAKNGRFCQPCAGEVAQEKNREHDALRHARSGEVRYLVKDGKAVVQHEGGG
jgi:hypothetical protein